MRLCKALIFHSIVSFGVCNAQGSIDSLRTANEAKMLEVSSLLGKWYTQDSIPSEIEFVKDVHAYLIIKPLLHGVDYYRFILRNDSIGVNGCAANWPPYDCILNLKDSSSLEIYYFQYFSEKPTTVLYKRIN